VKRLLTPVLILFALATAAFSQPAQGFLSPYNGPYPQALPNATVGVFYQVALQTNYNLTQCTAGGTLSQTLGLSVVAQQNACYIYGTPTQSTGGFPSQAFVVQAFTGAAAPVQVAIGSFTISVFSGQGPVQITTTSVPNGIVGVNYSFTFQATTGSGSITSLIWSYSGSLPLGLTFDSNGVLSGRPQAAGQYPFDVIVSAPQLDASDRRSYIMTVLSGPLGIVENSLPFGVVGQAYSVTVHAQGGAPPYSWSMDAGGSGLSIDSVSGLITGTPQTNGNFNVRVTVRDSSNATDTRNFALFVATALSITTSSLPLASPGTSYNQQLQATGGQTPYTWSIASGSLPPGLTLNTANGLISGTPTTEGRYQFTARVTDAGSRTATKDLSITVGQAVQITTASLPDGSVGVQYSATLTATGGQAPYAWAVTSGTLPAGLTLAASTGVISGTPTTFTAPTSFTITVTDAQNSTAQKSFTIGVASPLSITTNAAVDGVRGQPYSQAFGASGGTPPYTWSLAGGALPPGLTLDPAAALLSGTPATSGSYSFSIQVRDSTVQTASKTYFVTIIEPVSISTGNLTGTATVAFSQTLIAVGGTSPYTWAVVSGVLPSGLTLNPSTGVVSGTPPVSGSFTPTIQVTDSKGQSVTKAITFTINLPPVPPLTMTITAPGGGAAGAGQQAPLTLTLGSPFASEITGTLTLTFSAVPDDPNVRFNNGLRTLNFIFRQGSTTAIFPSVASGAVLTGTVAGTITITARMTAADLDVTPSPVPTQRIDIPPGPPVISSVQLQQSGGGINVVVTGYATTREITSGVFRFAAGTGATLSQSEFTVQLGSVFSPFFASSTNGSLFTLTLPVSVAGGPAASIVSVSVTLTNARGNSATVSP
jgi:hypothetical protein